jgi:nuclear transport factor 2 (NTF2) superfamily protein
MQRVALAYTEDSVWRNRSEFMIGRDQIRTLLAGKWARELDYRLVKALWAFTDNRIGVRFQYERHDDTGHWYRSYGNEPKLPALLNQRQAMGFQEANDGRARHELQFRGGLWSDLRPEDLADVDRDEDGTAHGKHPADLTAKVIARA